jgi:hypothetical protein
MPDDTIELFGFPAVRRKKSSLRLTVDASLPTAA